MVTKDIGDLQLMDRYRCPRCGAEAIYRYGRTPQGRKKGLCQVCGRQFVLDATRKAPLNRPMCPNCGGAMHIYMRAETFTRFRCKNYPACRTFVKQMEGKTSNEQ